jgi:predicted lysophospholipase L1 biosynthesis ABC-type transport system permease subunit
MADVIEIPEKIQDIILGTLSVLKSGAGKSWTSVVFSFRWLFVLSVGFLLGLTLYAALLVGLSASLKIVLAKYGLYRPHASPSIKEKGLMTATSIATKTDTVLKHE